MTRSATRFGDSIDFAGCKRKSIGSGNAPTGDTSGTQRGQTASTLTRPGENRTRLIQVEFNHNVDLRLVAV